MDTSGDKTAMLVNQIMSIAAVSRDDPSAYNRKWEAVHRLIGQARLADARAHYDTATMAVKATTEELNRQLAAANERAGRLEEQMVGLREAWRVYMTVSSKEPGQLENGRLKLERILGGA